jgi:hypothetical protein
LLKIIFFPTNSTTTCIDDHILKYYKLLSLFASMTALVHLLHRIISFASYRLLTETSTALMSSSYMSMFRNVVHRQ